MSHPPPSDAYVERALGLQPGTLRAHRQKPEISPPELVALLRLVETFPWLLEVADAGYDERGAQMILLRERPTRPSDPCPARVEGHRLLVEALGDDPPAALDFEVPGPDPGLDQEPHSKVRVVPRPPSRGDLLHIYTDGACQGNPGSMGIGVVLLDRLPGANPPRRELSEGVGHGTNNVAELTAVLRGLEVVYPQHRRRPLVVYSDSTYVIGVLARGWTARANQDLVERILRKLDEFDEVMFVKVPAHSGVTDNERADLLAKRGVAANSQLRSGRSPR